MNEVILTNHEETLLITHTGNVYKSYIINGFVRVDIVPLSQQSSFIKEIKAEIALKKLLTINLN